MTKQVTVKTNARALVLGALVACIAAFAMPVAASAATTAPKATATATFKSGGSIRQVWVTGATEGDNLMLVSSSGKILQQGAADRLGSKIFRKVTPGSSYTVRLSKGGKVYGSSKITVLKEGVNPKSSFYSQFKLHAGLNYVKMRDGVELAMTVRLPFGVSTLDPNKQYATYVEYSGYQTAAPHDYLAAVLSGNTNDVLLPASSTAVGAVIGPLLNFVTVSVQMRGSGCSGGAFDLFDLQTTYDGYDAIETVAAQSWVKNHKVGMGGISFSGISQLFVAGAQPPHLAAVTPLSVMDDVYTATGYPGGIFNDGFALGWITERGEDAQPAPEGGQAWARYLAANDPATGKPRDQHCFDNQKLRLQTEDAIAITQSNPYRDLDLYENRSPSHWVSNIKVPIFWVGAYNDEQTGPHWTESVSALKKNKKAWITMQNGVHVDSLGPSTITRWAEFMNLYVANRIPKVGDLVISYSGTLYQTIADALALPVQQSRFANLADTATNLLAARAQFERDPRITVLMENGNAIPGHPGAIGASWSLGFDAWPIKQTVATRYYFDANGVMNTSTPAAAGSVSYISDPTARPRDTLGGAPGDAWKAQPRYNWTPVAAGKGLGFTSPALSSNKVLIGPASVDLFLKSSAVNTDLQATISEVRPDGKETYIQTGWLRASHRKVLASKSTPLDPFQTFLQKDASNLPSGVYSLTRIQIPAFSHAFRAGSKIRITITAPGGDRPSWTFQTISNGETNTLSLGGAKPSSVNLPFISGAVIPAGKTLPGATALRGQPSRDYVAASNGG